MPHEICLLWQNSRELSPIHWSLSPCYDCHQRIPFGSWGIPINFKEDAPSQISTGQEMCSCQDLYSWVIDNGWISEQWKKTPLGLSLGRLVPKIACKSFSCNAHVSVHEKQQYLDELIIYNQLECQEAQVPFLQGRSLRYNSQGPSH